MRAFILATFAALVACAIGVPSVVKFNIKQEPKKVQLKNFQFKNCLPEDKEAAVINSLSFQPDPLNFPGPLTVSFDATAKQDIDSPLKTSVYLGKRVGSVWIKVPCIGSIGSCTYDDLCEILSQIPECPDPFNQAGVPCMCPFKTGNYKLPPATFDIEAAIFPPGDYHGQANVTMGGTVVGCYDILATFG